MLKGDRTIFGILFTAGIIIMCVTSRFFDNVQGMISDDYAIRDCIVMAGQDLGEILWVAGAWVIVKDFGLFKAIVEFTAALLIIDLIMVLFFNPYQPSWPKDTGFIISLCYVLVMTKRNIR